MNWILPEHIADALPREAARIEALRRAALDLFRGHGYELVMPPLLEYLDSLLTGAGRDLGERTCKLDDAISGKTMGVRADMTPQVTRIDAHLLNRVGVSRLCYCDSVLHTLPASPTATREPIQLGAELYGCSDVAADAEIVTLMIAVLRSAGLPDFRIDFGHVGVFLALAEAAGASDEDEALMFSLLQSKDTTSLAALVKAYPEPYRSALLRLPDLYGDVAVLARAEKLLPALPVLTQALAVLRHLAERMKTLKPSFDLADLRGYHYHNGVVFAAYCAGFPGPIALGGRYDNVGEAFGRARPATGFSLDLRELARLASDPPARPGVLAPAGDDARLLAQIAALRAKGEIVIQSLPSEGTPESPSFDRRLVAKNGDWALETLSE